MTVFGSTLPATPTMINRMAPLTFTIHPWIEAQFTPVCPVFTARPDRASCNLIHWVDDSDWGRRPGREQSIPRPDEVHPPGSYACRMTFRQVSRRLRCAVSPRSTAIGLPFTASVHHPTGHRDRFGGRPTARARYASFAALETPSAATRGSTAGQPPDRGRCASRTSATRSPS